VGVTPKLLDGARAHVVACMLDDDALGEDVLETMWHASERLLEPQGRLLPSALVVRVQPVEWLPFGAAGAALHGPLCAGAGVMAAPADAVRPLGAADAALRVDLLRRPDALPSAGGSATVARPGTLCGLRRQPSAARRDARGRGVEGG